MTDLHQLGANVVTGPDTNADKLQNARMRQLRQQLHFLLQVQKILVRILERTDELLFERMIETKKNPNHHVDAQLLDGHVHWRLRASV